MENIEWPHEGWKRFSATDHGLDINQTSCHEQLLLKREHDILSDIIPGRLTIKKEEEGSWENQGSINRTL